MLMERHYLDVTMASTSIASETSPSTLNEDEKQQRASTDFCGNPASVDAASNVHPSESHEKKVNRDDLHHSSLTVPLAFDVGPDDVEESRHQSVTSSDSCKRRPIFLSVNIDEGRVLPTSSYVVIGNAVASENNAKKISESAETTTDDEDPLPCHHRHCPNDDSATSSKDGKRVSSSSVKLELETDDSDLVSAISQDLERQTDDSHAGNQPPSLPVESSRLPFLRLKFHVASPSSSEDIGKEWTDVKVEDSKETADNRPPARGTTPELSESTTSDVVKEIFGPCRPVPHPSYQLPAASSVRSRDENVQQTEKYGTTTGSDIEDGTLTNLPASLPVGSSMLQFLSARLKDHETSPSSPENIGKEWTDVKVDDSKETADSRPSARRTTPALSESTTSDVVKEIFGPCRPVPHPSCQLPAASSAVRSQDEKGQQTQKYETTTGSDIEDGSSRLPFLSAHLKDHETSPSSPQDIGKDWTDVKVDDSKETADNRPSARRTTPALSESTISDVVKEIFGPCRPIPPPSCQLPAASSAVRSQDEKVQQIEKYGTTSGGDIGDGTLTNLPASLIVGSSRLPFFSARLKDQEASPSSPEDIGKEWDDVKVDDSKETAVNRPSARRTTPALSESTTSDVVKEIFGPCRPVPPPSCQLPVASSVRSHDEKGQQTQKYGTTFRSDIEDGTLTNDVSVISDSSNVPVNNEDAASDTKSPKQNSTLSTAHCMDGVTCENNKFATDDSFHATQSEDPVPFCFQDLRVIDNTLFTYVPPALHDLGLDTQRQDDPHSDHLPAPSDTIEPFWSVTCSRCQDRETSPLSLENACIYCDDLSVDNSWMNTDNRPFARGTSPALTDSPTSDIVNEIFALCGPRTPHKYPPPGSVLVASHGHSIQLIDMGEASRSEIKGSTVPVSLSDGKKDDELTGSPALSPNLWTNPELKPSSTDTLCIPWTHVSSQLTTIAASLKDCEENLHFLQQGSGFPGRRTSTDGSPSPPVTSPQIRAGYSYADACRAGTSDQKLATSPVSESRTRHLSGRSALSDVEKIVAKPTSYNDSRFRSLSEPRPYSSVSQTDTTRSSFYPNLVGLLEAARYEDSSCPACPLWGAEPVGFSRHVLSRTALAGDYSADVLYPEDLRSVNSVLSEERSPEPATHNPTWHQQRRVLHYFPYPAAATTPTSTARDTTPKESPSVRLGCRNLQMLSFSRTADNEVVPKPFVDSVPQIPEVLPSSLTAGQYRDPEPSVGIPLQSPRTYFPRSSSLPENLNKANYRWGAESSVPTIGNKSPRPRLGVNFKKLDAAQVPLCSSAEVKPNNPRHQLSTASHVQSLHVPPTSKPSCNVHLDQGQPPDDFIPVCLSPASGYNDSGTQLRAKFSSGINATSSRQFSSDGNGTLSKQFSSDGNGTSSKQFGSGINGTSPKQFGSDGNGTSSKQFTSGTNVKSSKQFSSGGNVKSSKQFSTGENGTSSTQFSSGTNVKSSTQFASGGNGTSSSPSRAKKNLNDQDDLQPYVSFQAVNALPVSSTISFNDADDQVLVPPDQTESDKKSKRRKDKLICCCVA